MAYYRLEPWGNEKLELMLAQQSAMFANAHRKPHSKAFKAEDFLVKSGKRDRQPWQEQLAMLRSGLAASAAVEKRKKRKRGD